MEDWLHACQGEVNLLQVFKILLGILRIREEEYACGLASQIVVSQT